MVLPISPLLSSPPRIPAAASAACHRSLVDLAGGIAAPAGEVFGSELRPSGVWRESVPNPRNSERARTIQKRRSSSTTSKPCACRTPTPGSLSHQGRGNEGGATKHPAPLVGQAAETRDRFRPQGRKRSRSGAVTRAWAGSFSCYWTERAGWEASDQGAPPRAGSLSMGVFVAKPPCL